MLPNNPKKNPNSLRIDGTRNIADICPQLEGASPGFGATKQFWTLLNPGKKSNWMLDSEVDYMCPYCKQPEISIHASTDKQYSRVLHLKFALSACFRTPHPLLKSWNRSEGRQAHAKVLRKCTVKIKDGPLRRLMTLQTANMVQYGSDPLLTLLRVQMVHFCSGTLLTLLRWSILKMVHCKVQRLSTVTVVNFIKESRKIQHDAVLKACQCSSLLRSLGNQHIIVVFGVNI